MKIPAQFDLIIVDRWGMIAVVIIYIYIYIIIIAPYLSRLHSMYAMAIIVYTWPHVDVQE